MAAEITLNGSTLVLRGKIEQGDADRYKSALSQPGGDRIKPKILRISSAGGQMLEAAALARLVAEDQPQIVVDGPCLSACASMIFVASSRRRFEAGGFLAFHGANAGEYRHMADLLAAVEKLPESDWRSAILGNTNMQVMPKVVEGADAMTREIYAQAQVSEDLNARVAALTSPRWCLSVNEAKKAVSITHEKPPRYDFWIPDDRALKKVGLESTGLSIHFRWLMAKAVGSSSDRIHWGELPPLKDLAQEPCIRIDTSPGLSGGQ